MQTTVARAGSIATRGLIVLAIILTLVAGWAVPASGQPPFRIAEGTAFFPTFEVLSQRSAGPNVIEERLISGTVEGDFAGTWVQTVRGVVHPNGQVTFHGTWTFTGELGECGEGTVSGRLTGRGEAGPLPQTVAQVTSSGSGNTADGHGTVVQDGPFSTYSIAYRC